jgi:hypothetical protein
MKNLTLQNGSDCRATYEREENHSWQEAISGIIILFKPPENLAGIRAITGGVDERACSFFLFKRSF